MSLKHHLDTFLDNFPRERHLANDPVQFVHRYDDPRDREIAGLIASAFAYGNVKIVLRTVAQALSYLGPRPAVTLAEFDPNAICGVSRASITGSIPAAISPCCFGL